MSSDPPKATRKWYSNGRWAWAFVLVGIMIVAFVVATGGEYGAWAMWFAIPLLMIGLVYFFAVNAIPVFLSASAEFDKEEERSEERRKK